MDTDEVAVVGIAGRFPGAGDVDAFWDNLRAGREGITFLDEEELLANGVPEEMLAHPDYVPAASAIEGYDLFDAPFFGYHPDEAARLDPQQRLFLETAWTALESSGHRPSDFDGSIGVYAASNWSNYLLNNVLTGRVLQPGSDTLEHILSNDKDYLASRVAYQLGLSGPAMCVQTACSSSLVTVHMAVQALASYECDLALAGGVALRFPHRVGYLFEEGLIFSRDGHCRPFDAGASGIVAGNGVAVVALKRLADAQADGDHVHAVIKGSAVNNDGRDKVGYTAPSVNGQAEVISTALAVAGVDARTVTAIEAHGTGTPLGDPIEVAALTKVFGTGEATGWCALGSVKSNLGHLDSAAGIAGLVKAVLQVEHGELVPSVNFDEPNPKIDFEHLPFFVPTRAHAWETGSLPRRIGVSSFGMGGTNAHVVLEQAPEPVRPPTAGGRGYQILPLSARDRAARHELPGRLGASLSDSVSLVDVAYTLQKGREEFPQRAVVVASSVAEAKDELLSGAEHTGSPLAAEPPRLVWMLPGQGSQYPNMGRELLDTEPVFREHIDHCAELLTEHLGRDIREVLYPPDPGDRTSTREELTQTALAQPALFCVEYALARLLHEWGLRPSGMIGHSLGELVAACLSGVFELPDALRVVAARGRLMQERPSGAMISVGAPAADVLAMADGTVSLASVNAADMCVVSGTHEDVGALREKLDAAEIPCRGLHTSHAFHSPMMDPILEPFERELAGIRLHEPEIPFVSNRTGDWITAAQATDPGYWAAHVRDAVLFGAGMAKVVEAGPCVLTELGPGGTLSTFARLAAGSPFSVVQTMPSATEHERADRALLTAVGRMWLAGADVDWAVLRGADGRRVGLPTYPFQRRQHWIEAGQRVSAAVEADDTAGEGTRPWMANEYVEPETEVERRIAAIWEAQLGVSPVGATDPFLELGGHSLLAVRVAQQIRDTLRVDVPIKELLATPTVRTLAEKVAPEIGPGVLDTGEPDAAAFRLPRAEPDPDRLHEPFPLSEIQQAQWIGRSGHFVSGDVPAYVYWEVDAEDLDLDRLQATFDEVMRRHGMLRAVIEPDGRQRILPDAGPYRFAVLDLSDVDTETRGTRLAELTAELCSQNLPTDRWPLFDIRLTKLGDRRYRLHLGFDLLIADIGSLRILLRDWRKLYTGEGATLRPLELSYRDYVLAATSLRNTPRWEQARDYWRDRIEKLPPAPELPLAIAPDSPYDTAMTAHRRVVPREVWQRFAGIAARFGLTPSSVLLAVYASVLGTWCRKGEFTLNVTVTNRLDVHEQVPDLVGEFASFDLVAIALDAESGVAGLATGIQEQSWADLEHRFFSGVDVLREMARRKRGNAGSTMPVVFTSTLVHELEPGDDSMFGWLGTMVHEEAHTPQVWIDVGVLPAPDGIQLSWHGVTALFHDGVLDAMFEAFFGRVVELAEDEDEWRRPVDSLVPAEQLAMITEANRTDGPQPEGYLYSPLAERAAAEPERTAVIDSARSLTFGELHRSACALAHRLRALGVGPNQLVGVSLPKSCEQVVAALGVLLAGGAYLPIDPELPAGRKDHLLRRGEARVLVTDSEGAAREWDGAPAILTVELDAEPSGPDSPPVAVHRADDLAYVIFTSGSTGEPKGVMLSHKAALNTLADINDRFEVTAQDRVLGLSSLSFDLSVWDIFGVLGAGGALVLPEPAARRDPARWLDLVVGHRVTMWNSVPALAEMFTEHVAALPERPELPVRLVMMSGDWIPVDLPDRLRALLPGARVISLGGATEAAVWSIYHEIDRVDPDWDSIPYGRPLRNQRMYVLNDRLHPCPVWAPGELYIGGAGVAEGYWRDPERTARSFITHPVTGERLYRTGDLGRWLPTGEIEFLGREDFQVKVGGYRIELGEIEAALLRHESVRTAVVTADGPERGRRQLAAYVVPAGPEWTDESTERLRGFLRETLPSYMVPAVIVAMDSLPLSDNGKVDRAALPRATGGPAEDSDGEPAALSPLVLRFGEILAELVGVDRITPEQNFFELGGDSIIGVQAVGKARAEGIELSLQDLFRSPTLSALASVLTAAGGGEAGGLLRLTPLQFELAGACAVDLTVRCVDADLLRRALDVLVQRHPMLRARLVGGDEGWGLAVGEATEPGYVSTVDLSVLPAGQREGALAEMTAEAAAELDPVGGPMFSMTLFDVGEENLRLVWLMHELVADARSWELLLEELFEVAATLRDGREPATCPPDDHYGHWASDHGCPGTGTPRAVESAEPAKRHSRIDSLSEERTAALIDSAWNSYRLGLDGIVLTALALARPESSVDLLTDGRAGGQTAAVGQFGVVRRVRPEIAEPGDVHAVITEVKRQLREETASDAGSGIFLRVLGEFAAEQARHPLAAASPSPWPRGDASVSPDRPTALTAVVWAGRLKLDWTWLDEADPELADAVLSALDRIAAHCAGPGVSGVTPEDFPLAGVSPDELAAVLKEESR